MPTPEELAKHIEELRDRIRDYGSPSKPNRDSFAAETEGKEFLRVHFGEHTHFYKKSIEHAGVMDQTAAALDAALSYVTSGRYTLNSVREEVELEVTGDILDQADALMAKSDAHDAAPAMLAGAALEERLRMMCLRHGCLPSSSRPGIENYKQELKKNGHISTQDGKDITSIAGIRNAAAHGRFDELSTQGVRVMLQQVRLLLSRHGAITP